MNTDPAFYNLESGAGDYPEDFAHENGMYSNSCHHCRVVFLGHKRRYECKQCHVKHTEAFNSLTDVQKKAIYDTFASGPIGM